MENGILFQIENWLTDPELHSKLTEIKAIFILFGFLFLLIFIYFLKKSSFLQTYFLQDWGEFISYQAYESKIKREKWKEIQERLKSEFEADWKLSILEAGELLNESLEEAGYTGETIIEKLEKTDKEIISNTQEILEIYKIYEGIIVDPDYSLKLSDAQKFLEIVERTLINLKII